jgi:hypothetical protein
MVTPARHRRGRCEATATVEVLDVEWVVALVVAGEDGALTVTPIDECQDCFEEVNNA